LPLPSLDRKQFLNGSCFRGNPTASQSAAASCRDRSDAFLAVGLPCGSLNGVVLLGLLAPTTRKNSNDFGPRCSTGCVALSGVDRKLVLAEARRSTCGPEQSYLSWPQGPTKTGYVTIKTRVFFPLTGCI